MTLIKRIQVILLAVFLATLLTSCGGAKEAIEQAEQEAPIKEEASAASEEAEVIEKEEVVEAEEESESQVGISIEPGEPPAPERILVDSTSSSSAFEKRAVLGDNFQKNLYERPFSSQEMVYQPDLDIQTVDFAHDDDFFYFTIRLFGLDTVNGKLNGTYAVEFDRTLTGRGDLVVSVENPGEKWSVENVRVFGDGNTDVGGPRPTLADKDGAGDGHDLFVEMKATNAAFARIDPQDPEAVQFAVSRALLDDPDKFLWGAWADNGLKNVGMFDYNDTMGISAAGSPNRGRYYPIKDLEKLDNTCRLPYGFEQTGTYFKGMCINTPPVIPQRPTPVVVIPEEEL